MENKFKAGVIVYEKMFPEKKMIVTRYAGKLYHCLSGESPRRREWLFFEKELMIVIDKNGINQYHIRSSQRFAKN